MANDPATKNPNVKKLKRVDAFRLRVGDWRIIYEIKDKDLIIIVLRIAYWSKRRDLQMNTQIIEKNGKPEWAVLPYEEYLHLLDATEDAEDLVLYKEAMARQDEELIPSEVVNRILDGESPFKVWREYRGLSQEQLAKAAGLSKPYISHIESGKRVGTIESLQAIAKALKVSIDLLKTA